MIDIRKNQSTPTIVCYAMLGDRGSEAQIAKAMLGKIGSPKSGLDPLFGEIFFRFDGLRRQKTVFQTIKWAGMDAAMACSAFAVS